MPTSPSVSMTFDLAFGLIVQEAKRENKHSRKFQEWLANGVLLKWLQNYTFENLFETEFLKQ